MSVKKELMVADDVEMTIKSGFNLASSMHHEYVTPEHILLAMLDSDDLIDIREALDSTGADTETLGNALQSYLMGMESKDTATTPRISSSTASLFKLFPQTQFDYIISLDLLLGIISLDKTFAHKALVQNGLNIDMLIATRYELETVLNDLKDDGTLEGFTSNTVSLSGMGENQINDGAPTGMTKEDREEAAKRKFMSLYVTNLTDKAATKQLGVIVGRDEVYTDMLRTFGRKKKSNVLLLGEPGVGKTAVLDKLATEIVNGDVPDYIKGYEVWLVDLNGMMSGTRMRGEFEERLEYLIKIAKKPAKVILAIDEAHTMFGQGTHGDADQADTSNILKPYLSNGDLKMVAITTFEDAKKTFDKKVAMNRRFGRITVEEPTHDETVLILEGIIKEYEGWHGIEFEKELLTQLVSLTTHIRDKRLPDKAIDIIDLVGSTMRANPTKYGKTVTLDLIQETVSKVAQVPLSFLKQVDDESLGNLEHNLKKDVLGQVHAVEILAEKLIMNQAGLKEFDKPMGAYLMIGPTGTGKTELAKSIARHTSNTHLIHLNMAEYMEQHAVSKLLGSPPGYVGHGDGAKFIDDLNKHPNSILLLDEIEKAHPDIMNIFLAAMEEATITSSTGVTASLRNTLILFTSNVGAVTDKSLGFFKEEKSTKQKEMAEEYFSPEFRNRLDGIIQFNPLSNEIVTGIVEKFLNELKFTVEERNITLTWNNDVVEHLVSVGYDELMGARPLKRVIQNEIKVPMSKKMVFGDLKNGGTVSLSMNEGVIQFS